MSVRDASKKTAQRDSNKPVQSNAPAFTFDDGRVLAEIPIAELTPNVHKVIRSLIAEIKTLRVELAHAQGQVDSLERLADHDSLLNIYNRRAFVRELERVLAMINRYDLPACMIFIDLNGLKTINDERGHAAGDAALLHVSRLLKSHTRQTDVVGRLGGDEFGVLLTHVARKQAEKKAADLSRLISETPVEAGNEASHISVSFGVVQIIKGETAGHVMAEADIAMYAAKRND